MNFYYYKLRWQLFYQPIIAEPDSVVKYTKAVVALHNYLRAEESSVYCPSGFADEQDGHDNIVPGTWQSEGSPTGLSSLGSVSGNRSVIFKPCFNFMHTR